MPGDCSCGINVSLRPLLKRLSNTSVANASPIALLKYCGITGPTHTETITKKCNTNISSGNLQPDSTDVFSQNMAVPTDACINAMADLSLNLQMEHMHPQV
jgi:hypothetical protein